MQGGEKKHSIEKLSNNATPRRDPIGETRKKNYKIRAFPGLKPPELPFLFNHIRYKP